MQMESEKLLTCSYREHVTKYCEEIRNILSSIFFLVFFLKFPMVQKKLVLDQKLQSYAVTKICQISAPQDMHHIIHKYGIYKYYIKIVKFSILYFSLNYNMLNFRYKRHMQCYANVQ